MRARNIKPGFYKNEDLAACSVYARLLAPGLWMMADREGRMEYRPLRIKAEIFPYDSVEVHVLLEELEGAGHIQTFYHGDKRFVQICKFADHQRPHQNEAQSTIPAPPPKSATQNQQVAETSHHGSKCFAPREQALRSESVSLFSESPSLNAESVSLTPAFSRNAEVVGHHGQVETWSLLPEVLPAPDPRESWFDEFWGIYGKIRNADKQSARRAFLKAVQSETRFRHIMQRLELQRAGYLAREPGRRPHASTWLNGARWDDDPDAPSSAKSGVLFAQEVMRESKMARTAAVYLASIQGTEGDDEAYGD